jgi:hypothetical protein
MVMRKAIQSPNTTRRKCLAAYFTRETAMDVEISFYPYLQCPKDWIAFIPNNDQGNSLTVGNWNQQQRCHALLKCAHIMLAEQKRSYGVLPPKIAPSNFPHHMTRIF